MAKKLYRCRAEVEFYVLANEEPDDLDLHDYVLEEVNTNGVQEHVSAVRVKAFSEVPDEASGTLPWGGTDDRTITQLASEIWPAEKV